MNELQGLLLHLFLSTSCCLHLMAVRNGDGKVRCVRPCCGIHLDLHHLWEMQGKMRKNMNIFFVVLFTPCNIFIFKKFSLLNFSLLLVHVIFCEVSYLGHIPLCFLTSPAPALGSHFLSKYYPLKDFFFGIVLASLQRKA